MVIVVLVVLATRHCNNFAVSGVAALDRWCVGKKHGPRNDDVDDADDAVDDCVQRP